MTYNCTLKETRGDGCPQMMLSLPIDNMVTQF